jgi:hypothetical protein
MKFRTMLIAINNLDHSHSCKSEKPMNIQMTTIQIEKEGDIAAPIRIS